MKKHILPLLFAAGMLAIAPLKANHPAEKNNSEKNSVTATDPEKAKDLSDRAWWIILLNSDNSDSLHNAIDLCNQAIQLNPELMDAYFNRADAKCDMKNYTEALADLNIVVDKRGEARDFEYRGECKFKMNDNDGALADYQMAESKGYCENDIRRLIANGDANQLGVAFYNLQQYDKAITAFTISVNAEKTKTNLYNRGNAEYLSNDRQAALVDWKAAGKMGNKDAKKSYKKFRKEK